MKPENQAFRPHHWIVLSAPVHAALQAEPEPAGSLLRLRFESGLVEQAAPRELPARLRRLQRAGCTTVHLVFERLDATELRTLQRQLPEGLDVQLHDWSALPRQVVMNLATPEPALLDAIADLGEAPRSVLAPDRRWRDALADWERSAREAHGEDFDRLYGRAPIRWHVADDLLTRLVGVVQRFAPGGAPAPARQARGALALAAGGAVAAAPALAWSARDEQGVTLIRFSRRDENPNTVGIDTQWTGAGTPPHQIYLNFVDQGFRVGVVESNWRPSARRAARHGSTRVIADPVGALWLMLSRLHADDAPTSLQIERPAPH